MYRRYAKASASDYRPSGFISPHGARTGRIKAISRDDRVKLSRALSSAVAHANSNHPERARKYGEQLIELLRAGGVIPK
jgi:hypothetical protein